MVLIVNYIWSWIRAYLTNRTQCVSINGRTSTVLPVVSGVAQGSLLHRPLFYISYINDRFDTIKVASHLHMLMIQNCDGSISFI